MIKLGATVREKITGFTGIACARCEYLWGCVQYEVKAQEVTGDGKIVDFWFDEERLEEVIPTKTRKGKSTGGPQNHPPRRA